jgi:hypothetical protein
MAAPRGRRGVGLGYAKGRPARLRRRVAGAAGRAAIRRAGHGAAHDRRRGGVKSGGRPPPANGGMHPTASQRGCHPSARTPAMLCARRVMPGVSCLVEWRELGAGRRPVE